MIKFQNLLFSHKQIISDISQKTFRFWYGVAILFFVAYTIHSFMPVVQSDQLDTSLPYMETLDLILLTYLLYSLLFLKKIGWYIFVGSLISISVSTVRFVLLMLFLHVVEFVFHVILIKLAIVSSKTLNSTVDHIEFISFGYYYFILVSFLFAHYKSEFGKAVYLDKN